MGDQLLEACSLRILRLPAAQLLGVGSEQSGEEERILAVIVRPAQTKVSRKRFRVSGLTR